MNLKMPDKNRRYLILTICVSTVILFTLSTIVLGKENLPIVSVNTSNQDKAASYPLTGIWRGGSTFLSGSGGTFTNSDVELILKQEGANLTGNLELRLGEGRHIFTLTGTMNGNQLSAKTTSHKLLGQFPRGFEGFYKCTSLSVDLEYSELNSLDRNAITWAVVDPGIPMMGPTMIGLMEGSDSQGAGCFNLFGISVNTRLIKQYDSLVIFVGGAMDSKSGNMRDLVWQEYKNKYSPPLGQKTEYFPFDAREAIKGFIFTYLMANPQASVSLIGHSLGGRRVWHTARDLSQEVPLLTVDLLITLDPVNKQDESDMDSSPDYPAVSRPRNRRSTPPVIDQRVKPTNVSEWINIYVDASLFSTKCGDAIATLGGQWGKQINASSNTLFDSGHCSANRMFFELANGIRPVEKVKQLKAASGFDRYKALSRISELYVKYKEHYTPSQPQVTVELLSNEVNSPNAPSTNRSRNTQSGNTTKKAPGSQTFRFDVRNRLLTPVKVKKGDTITIDASGVMSVGLIATATPDGTDGYESYSYFPEANHAALLVRVKNKESDLWDVAGSSYIFVADRDGVLEFLVNDADYSNNVGVFAVAVNIKRQ